jgi:hypothetical protein
MRLSDTRKLKHFTPFFSAAEEAAAAAADAWPGEGCHTFAKSGYIIQNRGGARPYNVIFEHEDGPSTEHACDTIRGGELMIRRNTPVPAPRWNIRDQEASAL